MSSAAKGTGGSREARAAARRSLGASYSVAVYRLGEEPLVAGGIPESPTERLAQLAVLSRNAFRLAGIEPTRSPRDQWVGNVIRERKDASE